MLQQQRALNRFKLFDFKEGPPQGGMELRVPHGSLRRAILVTPEGVDIYYETPVKPTPTPRIDKYQIVKTGDPIAEDLYYVETVPIYLDELSSSEKEQLPEGAMPTDMQLIVFHLYAQSSKRPELSDESDRN